jgi:hypothetical protein
MENQRLGPLIALMIAGLAGGLWQLAVLTNWRGYADGHLSRVRRTTAVMQRLPGYRTQTSSDSDGSRRFMKISQRLVASVLFTACCALVVVAGWALVMEIAH